MTELWASFDPRAVARRIQDRASSSAKAAKVANPTPQRCDTSQISPPTSTLAVGSANLSEPLRPWTAEDWTAFFHERAGIRQCDGGLPRAEAERLALEETAEHWRALHPLPASEPEHGCVHCGGGARAPDLVPHLGAGRGHFWLHNHCWPAFDLAQRARAMAELRKLIPDLPELAA